MVMLDITFFVAIISRQEHNVFVQSMLVVYIT